MQSDSNHTSNTATEFKAIEDYINSKVGITRKTLNIRAAIGIIIFGWLMVMNYDDLGKKGIGWAFLIAMGFAFAIANQIEPMVGIRCPIIYVAAWVHTNSLVTEKQRLAREQYFMERSPHLYKW